MANINLKKIFVTAVLPLALAACASRPIMHNLNSECLHEIKDDKGQTLSVEFDAKCGQHKEQLAQVKIGAETEKALQKIQATQDAQINVIQEEKSKIFWGALAQRAALEIGNPQQEDTATRLLIAARTHEDPAIREMLASVQKDLGISDEMLNSKNEMWDKIREAQAKPGIQILELGNGEYYMDKYKHPYGPLAASRP